MQHHFVLTPVKARIGFICERLMQNNRHFGIIDGWFILYFLKEIENIRVTLLPRYCTLIIYGNERIFHRHFQWLHSPYSVDYQRCHLPWSRS